MSYCIKSGYSINDSVITHENVGPELYWNSSRVNNSKLYQYAVYRDVISVAQQCGARSLADIGCGTGEKLRMVHEALPKLEIFGVDQKHVIDYCVHTHDFGHWFVDDLSVPSLDFKVDLTICSDVVEHLLNPDILVNYLKRITKPDGLIMISTPDRDLLHGVDCMHCPNKAHVREWNCQEFVEYLRSHDFEILRHYHTPPVKFSFSKVFFTEIAKRLLMGKSINYNQVALLRNLS